MLAYYVLIFLVIYIGLMIFLGYYGSRKVKAISDFTAALSSYGPIPVALAYAAVWSSAITFIGTPGFIYGIGPPGAQYIYLGMAGTLIAAALATYYFRRMIEKMKPLTLFEYLGKRFESDGVMIIAAITYVFGILFFCASALTGGGTILAVVLDVPFQLGLCLCALICVVYILLGGTHGTTLTAVVQSTIMTISAVVIFLIGFVFLFEGGVSEVIERASAQGEQFSGSHIFSTIDRTFMLPSVIGIFIGHIAYAFSPHVAKTVLILQDKRQVLPFLIWTTLIMSLMILVVWAGWGARAYLADPNLHPDYALPTLIVTAFHPIVAALLCVAIFSAAMSSFGPMLLTWSSSIAHDIYRKYIVPRTNSKTLPDDSLDKREFLYTRLLLIVGTLISIIIVWDQPEYLIIMLWTGFGATIAGIAPNTIISTMWRGASKAGAIASNIMGVVCYLFTFMVLEFTPFEAAGVAITLSAIVLVVVSLFTRKPSKDVLDDLFDVSDEYRRGLSQPGMVHKDS